MCLIIHKPAGRAFPDDLLAAALNLNPDGFGLMGTAPDGGLILTRQSFVTLPDLLSVAKRHVESELVLHLRKRTRGDAESHNAHPFRIIGHTYLMHNGTLRLPNRVPGRSDTWHFVQDVLRPLAQRRPGVLLDNAFLQLMALALKPENKVVLYDHPARRVVILNRDHGAELDGLWLSSTRWIDRRLLPLARPPQQQERSYAAAHLQLL